MPGSPKERTLRSLQDGFGGDTYRRRETTPGRFQCGCYWAKAHQVPGATQAGVTGDVLVQCPLHQRATEAK